jgi:hypothetical protein
MHGETSGRIASTCNRLKYPMPAIRFNELEATHFRLRTLEKVGADMSLHVLACNLKLMIAVFGVQPLIQSMRASLSPSPHENLSRWEICRASWRSRVGP